MLNECFVICPIGDEKSATRERSDKFFEAYIKPICEKLSIEPVRSDKINRSGSISTEMINKLNQSQLVIVDITDHNPNVFFELGIRYKSGFPILIVKHKDFSTPNPFDIKDIRIFEYSFDTFLLDDLLKNMIEATSNISYSNSSVLTENNENGNKLICTPATRGFGISFVKGSNTK